MNKFLIYIVVLILPIFGFSQKDTIAYLYTFGSVANDVGEDIAATDDGGFAMIGSTASSGDGNTDIYLLKVDSLCNYQWSWALGGVNNDWGYAIKQTFDKGFIIAASTNSYGNGGYDAMLLKRDSLGNYEWQKTYGGNDWDFAYDVVQTFDSGFVFCGETYNNTNGFADVYVVKTNSVGDTLWTKTVGGSLIDKGNALIQTLDSNIVVAGIKNTISDSTQAYVLKFNKDGTLLWDSVYGGSGYEWINDIIESSIGKYSIAGATTSNSNGDLNYYILNLDEQGNVNWNFTIVNGSSPTPDDDEMFAIDVMANGQLLFMGYSATGGSGEKNIAMFTLTSSGFWGGTATVLATPNDDVINSIHITSNDRIIGTGKTNSFGMGNQDVLLLKMDTVLPTQTIQVAIYEDIAPIGIRTVENTGFVEIFPSLVEDYFYISSNKDYLFDEIELFNLNGQSVIKQYTMFNRVNISNLISGMYFVVLKQKGKKIFQTKIIKK